MSSVVINRITLNLYSVTGSIWRKRFVRPCNRSKFGYITDNVDLLRVCKDNEIEAETFRTESVTKATTINTRWEATQSVLAEKLSRLTHKIAIQLHLVAGNCTICSSRSRRPVRKLSDTPSYMLYGLDHPTSVVCLCCVKVNVSYPGVL
jgi:hypothetical protein